MNIPTWESAKAKLSISVNKVQIPFINLPRSMHRFVRPAQFSTGHDVYELNRSGTAFMCQYHNLRIAMTTYHQTGLGGLTLPSAEKFVVLAQAEGKTLAIPPHTIRRPRIEEEEFKSLEDLWVFDFGERVSDGSVQTFDLSEVLWSDAPGVTVEYAFLIGYPTSSERWNFNEDDEAELIGVVSGWILQDLQADEPGLMDTEHRNMFIQHERSNKLEVEPDGLSGSPVFSIVHDAALNRHLRFDGIVTNARGSRFAVYPSIYIRDFLDLIVADASQAQK